MSERSCRNCQYQFVCRSHIGQSDGLAEVCSTYQHRIDRDALLELADEMQGHADAEDYDGDGRINAGCLWSYADRIREALVVTDNADA